MILAFAHRSRDRHDAARPADSGRRIAHRLTPAPTWIPITIAWLVGGCLPLVAGAWWPIAAASGVLDERTVTFDSDWISFAPVPDTWVVQPWLAALTQYGTWHAAGAWGLSMLSATLWATIAWLVVSTARRAGASASAATIASLVTLPLLWPLILQPQTFAVLCVALLVRVLWSTRWIVAPLIVAAWANVHGSVPAASLLCLAAAAGAVAPAIPARLRRPLPRAAWVAACIAATFASPLGIGLVDYVREINSIQDVEQYTTAWSARPLLSPVTALVAAFGAFAAWSAFTGAALRRHGLATRVATITLLLLLTAAAMSAQRHSVWLAVVAAPHVALGIDRLRARRARGHDVRRSSPLVRWSIAGGIAVFLVATFPGTPLQRELSSIGIPSDRLLDAIDDSDVVYAPIAAADAVHVMTGSRVFVDARLERFAPGTLEDYRAIDRGDVEPIAASTPRSGRVVVVVDRGAQRELLAALDEHECARRLESDDDFVAFDYEPTCP